jgi:hypothetical protein
VSRPGFAWSAGGSAVTNPASVSPYVCMSAGPSRRAASQVRAGTAAAPPYSMSGTLPGSSGMRRVRV